LAFRVLISGDYAPNARWIDRRRSGAPAGAAGTPRV